jgi:hypothetical protein
VLVCPGIPEMIFKKNMIYKKQGRVRKEREKVEKCSNKTENKTEKTGREGSILRIF